MLQGADRRGSPIREGNIGNGRNLGPQLATHGVAIGPPASAPTHSFTYKCTCCTASVSSASASPTAVHTGVYRTVITIASPPLITGSAHQLAVPQSSLGSAWQSPCWWRMRCPPLLVVLLTMILHLPTLASHRISSLNPKESRYCTECDGAQH